MTAIFEQAARLKLRFDSPKGQLSAEDLWDLPLTSGTGKANLDDIARSLHRELRNSVDTASFVTPAETRGTATTQLKFDIAKHIIDVRVKERDDAAAATKKRETKQRILELIAEKQDGALKEKSIDELTALANSM